MEASYGKQYPEIRLLQIYFPFSLAHKHFKYTVKAKICGKNNMNFLSYIETLQKIRAGLKQAKSVAEAEALIRAHANF